VSVERRGDGILLVGFGRPAAGNLLDPPIFLGIGNAWRQLESDPELRVAVLYANGPDFSLGVDVPALGAALASGQFPPKDPDFIQPLATRPPYRTKPVVVAVQGGTKFGAHELFLAADIRVAATNSMFSQGEVTRGVFPAGGGTIRFPREAGWSNAMRYMLTGEEWGADEAKRLGLVQEVTRPGKQRDRAIEIARKIAAAAPLGVVATMTTARLALAAEQPAFDALRDQFARVLRSDDRKEYARAAAELGAGVPGAVGDRCTRPQCLYHGHERHLPLSALISSP
jgi:enoyl-CoA hydratase/carnithine racemase